MRKFAALVLVLAALACNSEPRPLTSTELKLVLTASSFTEWGMPGLDARNDKVETHSNMDGSMTIKCEHDAPKVFFISGVQIFSSEIGTDDEFTKSVAAYKTGVSRVAGRFVRESPELLTSGDQHYAATMFNGIHPIGNIFVVRRGRVLHTLVMSRIYFDDAADVQRLFAPMFAASDAYLGEGK